jgi:protein gp37
MADKSTIEWTDATWNPVRGCSRVSPGCGGPGKAGGCYAEGIAARFSDPGQAYHGFAERGRAGSKWTGKVALIEEQLALPLSWRKPRRIFVNSMSDLFHDALSPEDIAQVFAVMACAQQHTFQVLTKRAERMRDLLNDDRFRDTVNMFVEDVAFEHSDPHARRSDDYRAIAQDVEEDEPLPNVWLGVSVEDRQRADERIPHLLKTPAAVRFLSCEPLLGPLDLTKIAVPDDAAGRYAGQALIDWVIAGGESGPNARPMHPDWARSLRDQCAAAGVPFFFKQWGEWLPDRLLETLGVRGVIMRADGMRPSDADIEPMMAGTFDYSGWQHFAAVGKKRAGRLLDGVEHNAFPEPHYG